jgi:integrase/recombinase XerC
MMKEIEAYLAQRMAEGLAKRTLVGNRRLLSRLVEYLTSTGVHVWQNVRPQHVDGYISFLERSALRFSSREQFVITARCFLRWLAERGSILSDPSCHLELPRPTKDELPLLERPLSENDVAELLASMPRGNVIDLRNSAHIELLYSAGLRMGESVSLNVGDIDFSENVIRVRHGKGGKARDVPLMRGLASALKDYLCLRRGLLKGPDHGALLIAKTGKRHTVAAFERYIAKLNRKRTGKPHIHPHLFRHSIAVHLLRGGADIRYVQAFLGHDNLESTKIYLRLVPADLRKAYDAAMPEISLQA